MATLPKGEEYLIDILGELGVVLIPVLWTHFICRFWKWLTSSMVTEHHHNCHHWQFQ